MSEVIYKTSEARRLAYRNWCLLNKDKVKASCKSWRLRNPEASKASARSWGERNRQKKLDGMKRWRDKNGHRFLHYNSARRAKVTQKSIPEIDIFYKFCRLLNQQHRHYKPRGMFHVDHVIPLSKGGKHEACNLRVTTARFNLSKYNAI